MTEKHSTINLKGTIVNSLLTSSPTFHIVRCHWQTLHAQGAYCSIVSLSRHPVLHRLVSTRDAECPPYRSSRGRQTSGGALINGSRRRPGGAYCTCQSRLRRSQIQLWTFVQHLGNDSHIRKIPRTIAGMKAESLRCYPQCPRQRVTYQRLDIDGQVAQAHIGQPSVWQLGQGPVWFCTEAGMTTAAEHATEPMELWCLLIPHR